MSEEKRELDFFNKYLSLWVAICIVFGTAIGYIDCIDDGKEYAVTINVE